MLFRETKIEGTNKLKHGVLSLLLLAWFVLLAGCNSNPQPVGLSGSVTLDGKLLESGKIEFEPFEKLRGQRRNAPILNGQYELAPRKGLLPGMEFKVMIKAFKKTGKKYPSTKPAESFDEEIQYLPEIYNSKSNLKVTISAIESQNRFEFKLLSENK